MDPDAFDLAGCCVGSSSATGSSTGRTSGAGDAIVGPGVVRAARRTASRSCGAARASGDLDLARPYQEQLKRSLGDAARRAAVAAEPAHALATLGRGAPDADPDLRAGRSSSRASALGAGGDDLHGVAHVTGGGLPGNVPRVLPDGPRRAPGSRRVADAVGHPPVRRARRPRRRRAARDVQRRASGWSSWSPPTRSTGWRSPSSTAAGIDGVAGRRGVGRSDGRAVARYARGAARPPRERPDRGRRVGRRHRTSGRCRPRAGAGELGGEVVLVFADRAVSGPATGRRSRGSTPRSSAGGDDDGARRRRSPAPAPGRRRPRRLHAGPRAARCSRPFARPDHQHPPVAAARRSPAPTPVRDALAAGVRVTGCTIHLVDATLDGGPILAQEAVAGPARTTTSATLHERIKAVEHRLLPRGGALWRVLARRRPARTSARWPTRRSRRAGRCSRSRTRPASPTSPRASSALGFELVSTGGTARALRDAGLPVTDVAAVTASRRCSTAGSRRSTRAIHGGDPRRPAPRRPPASSWRRRRSTRSSWWSSTSTRSRRPPSGPAIALRRARSRRSTSAARRWSGRRPRTTPSVASSPSPDAVRRRARRRSQRTAACRRASRAALAVEAFRHTAAYDARIAAGAAVAMGAGIDLPDGPDCPGADPYPPTLTSGSRRSRRSATARTRTSPRPATADRAPTPADGPFASGAPPLQGKALSYNNVLDAVGRRGARSRRCAGPPA